MDGHEQVLLVVHRSLFHVFIVGHEGKKAS